MKRFINLKEGLYMSTVVGGIHGTAAEQSWGEGLRQLKAWMWQSMVAGAVLVSEMSFMDHLEELRKRIIKAAIAIAVGTTLCVAYTAEIIVFLKRPALAAGIDLVSIEGMGIFSLYFRVATAGGICLASPVILWQVWRFIEPALYKHEKRYALPFILSTILCFALGAVFGYTVAAPWLLVLEETWAKAVGIKITMSALSYIGLLTSTVVAMGAVFEMPPIVAILSRIGLVDARFLLRHIKHAILIFAFVSAIVTPTGDIAPMLGFMGVMMALYAVSIVVAWICGRPRKVEAEID
jgi:sec-independent protein translocase protein TatC